MNPLRIGFFGDGPWARASLRALMDEGSCVVTFVCPRSSDPDRDLLGLAEAHAIPSISLQNVNSSESLRMLHEHHCDAFVSMSYDQILRHQMFSMPRLGTINCHAGLLPFYRGRSVLNWALINDEPEFGVTVHFIDEGIDTGDIILQERLAITDDDDYESLLTRATQACSSVLPRAVRMLAEGTFQRVPQSTIHPVGTYFTRRRFGDEVIDWTRTSREVFNLVRAIRSPGPGARTTIDDDEFVIIRVSTPDTAQAWHMTPGAVIARSRDSFSVKTGDTFVTIDEWSGRLPRIGERFRSGN